MIDRMEFLRHFVRRFVGTGSNIYRAASGLLDFLSTWRKEGLQTWHLIKSIEREKKNSTPPRPVGLKCLKYPILIRPGTQDAGTVINNVIRAEYGHFKPSGEPEWMIDAGAYIGDTAAYFLSCFPKLKVIALEPNPDNHAIADQNLKPYGNRVVLLKKGLFSKEGELCFSGSGTGGAISDAGIKINCTSLPGLIRQFSIPRINILKMDIEGAEEAVFLSAPEAWLNRVDLLIMEIHGDSIRSLITRVMTANDFSMEYYRSIWYCRARSRP